MYKVIAANQISKLEEQINEYIKKGWKLVGGVSVTFDSRYNNDLVYVQSITKSSKPIKE